MVIIKQYDFVLCDLNMPVLNGYQCAEKIWSFYNEKNLFQVTDKDGYCPLLIACSSYIDTKI